MDNLWNITPDSNKAAVNFDNNPVTEDMWVKAFSVNIKEGLMTVNEFDADSSKSKEYTDTLLDLKLRFQSGERTQALWNDLMNAL